MINKLEQDNLYFKQELIKIDINTLNQLKYLIQDDSLTEDELNKLKEFRNRVINKLYSTK